MKSRFVQLYLMSAGLILAVTAVGKAIPVHSLNLCIEEPIFGSFQDQFAFTNQSVLWSAAAIELGILSLICFSRRKWLPCLAAGLWGAACLFVRVIFLNSIIGSCDCLGWLKHVLPLSDAALGSVLLTGAVWLAGGGLVSFGLMLPGLSTRERESALVTVFVMCLCVGAFLWYFPPEFGARHLY